MTFQEIFEVRTSGRGFTEITSEVERIVRGFNADAGIVHIFPQHTSCSVLITENADRDVLRDLETLAQRWAPDGDPGYRHDTEGNDDMAAHARSMLTGSSVTVPIRDRKLLLGTWQGIYLWEQRTQSHLRHIVVSVIG